MRWKGTDYYAQMIKHRTLTKTSRLLGMVVDDAYRIEPAGTVTCITETGEKRTVNLVKWIRPAPLAGPVYVTDLGMTVHNSQVLSDYSVITASFAEARVALASHRKYKGKAPVLKQGTVLGMICPLTYGDWFRGRLLEICSNTIKEPVVFSNRFAWERSYIRRDMQRMGIQVYVVGEEGVVVENPLLLATRGPLHHWLPGQADLLRKGMKVTPVVPRAGSLLYLSREGTQATSVYRPYMSRCIEQLTQELGGRVVRTQNDTPFEEYVKMGEDAETVIADLGSAESNLAWWKTKKVVEIQSTQKNIWALSLGHSAGVEQFHCIDSVGKTEEQLVQLVRKALDTPIAKN